ncbi:acyltransferase family protein [Candidatus Electronema sp. JM]|uniref:acyltransferase family protein n=1 Tax=Candidatus Electronema sp. JM TaxID=3401571 RepID=UPI003AA7EC59
MPKRSLLAVAAALLVFAALFFVCRNLLFSASFVEAELALDHPDRLQVFYSGSRRFSEHDSVFSALIQPSGQPQTVRVKLGLAPLRKLRLDFGERPGLVRLHKVTVGGEFTAARTLLPEEIFRLFRSAAPDTVLRLRHDAVEITTGTDPQIVCSSPLLRPQPLLLWGIPLLFALLTCAAVQQTDFASLPPFADLRSKRPSTGENINALDGLRGLALLLVIADHTWGTFSGLGRSGVWIFMTLSGFLIARPFVQQPERAVSLSFLSHFFFRRAKRILPVYYTYVVFIFLMSCRFNEALLHFLFLKGNGHLWVVPQEMLFYLLTPPVMLLCWLCVRLRPWLVLPMLTLLVIAANRFSATAFLRGCMNETVPLFFGVFLGGVLAAWLHKFWQEQVSLAARQKAEPWAAGAVIAILLFFLCCTDENFWGSGHRIFAQIYFPCFAAAAALLILAALAAGAAPAVRFLTWTPLRALSLVSFSIYIFHPLIIELLHKTAELSWGQHLTGLPLFLATLLCSYFFACITYSLLERPFLRSA